MCTWRYEDDSKTISTFRTTLEVEMRLDDLPLRDARVLKIQTIAKKKTRTNNQKSVEWKRLLLISISFRNQSDTRR